MSRRLKSVDVGAYERHNCCYSVALSILLDIPFNEVDALFTGHVMKSGRINTYTLKDITKDLTGELWNNLNITLGQFVKQYPKGKYFVLIRGHAIAVINGIVHDWKNRGKNTRVHSFMRIDN